jgi:pimeloyl-ACP methyl ester carboxylesterase
VAMELLARQAEGHLATRVEAILLLNGGVYVDQYHPLPIQTALQRPVLGAVLSRLITERSFNRSFARIFSERHPIASDELHQHWQAVRRRDGTRNYHRLIRYIGERKRHKARWEAALERPGVPARYVWGMRDPVSGGQMMARLRERAPGAAIRALDDVGHYPQIEAPDVVAAEILQFFAATPVTNTPPTAETERSDG